MQAMRVRRLSDLPSEARLYLDGKRVSRDKWNYAHSGKRIDTLCSRMQTRRDGSVVVREYHCIRG